MSESRDFYALIPARGGSERIPGKNLRPLGGKPLIAHTIEAARAAKAVDRVVVSTDSDEIADVAVKFGAEAPFRRPKEISGTRATELEFLDHALDWFRDRGGGEPRYIVLLYPTSPFRTAGSIDRAIAEIERHPDADALRSVRLCSEHPSKMWKIADGRLRPLIEEADTNVHARAYQSLPEVYVQNASIYIIKTTTIRNLRTSVGNRVIPFVMDESESVDVNTPLDFQRAEALLHGR